MQHKNTTQNQKYTDFFYSYDYQKRNSNRNLEDLGERLTHVNHVQQGTLLFDAGETRRQQPNSKGNLGISEDIDHWLNWIWQRIMSFDTWN